MPNRIATAFQITLPLFMLLACARSNPDKQAADFKRFAPCPDKPNCVSSLIDDDRKIEPLKYKGRAVEAKETLKKIIAQQARTKLITEEDRYLHFEFKIAVFGYIDDVEFLFKDDDQIIHMKSASREGNWDLGVNRRRLEGIRKLWKNRF